MRNRVITLTAALLLASASALMAQQQPAASTSDPTTVSPIGTIDFGYRGTSSDGDEARYERYRDLRTGVFTDITIGKFTDTKSWNAEAWNIGYHDSRYVTNYNSGKMLFKFMWDSIPLNYSYLTSTPWVEASSTGEAVLTLDQAARLAVQNKVPGVVGVPQNTAQLATRSIYVGLAQPFDLTQRRDTLSLGTRYDKSESVSFDVAYQMMRKSGHQPYGASFAFNVADEVAVPLDNHTNDITAGIEFTKPQGMMRASYSGSWFNNNVHDLVFDNPYRATDTNPYDPSGYSNGNGPARGRMAMAPNNNQQVFSVVGLYKMPSHSTLNGTVSFLQGNQNDALIPWTINPVIANPSVYASFPGLANLSRNTAEAEVKGVNALLNYTTRPTNFFGFNIRYRYNDHKNNTPAFDAVEYVRFDAVPEETGGETEQFNIRQNTFNINGTFNVAPRTALKIEYVADDYRRTGRAFADMTDYILRTSVDVVGTQYFTVRALYEHNDRVGSGFSQDAIEEGGAQPGLRFYDEADRTRNRGSIMFMASPTESFDVNFVMSAYSDTYGGPGHEFGLLESSNHAYTVGVNYTPNDRMSVGANAGWDKNHGFQQSSNSNPSCTLNVPPCPPGTYDTWTDPNRIWNLTNDEMVKQYNIFVDFVKIKERADIRFGYDYENSDNPFVHGGPRIAELQQNKAFTPGDTAPCAAGVTSCFIPLPSVTNTWHRFTTDLRYMFGKKVGFAVAYWYEKLDVYDYATIDTNGSVGFTPATGTPRIDYLGEISTGYGNRPYSGQTGFIRLLYNF